MKIAFFEADKQEIDFISNNDLIKGSDIEPVFFDDKLDKHNFSEAKDFEAISIFVGSKLDKKVLSKLKNLKYVVTRSTGYDHIDMEHAQENDILVSNIPNYGEHTVAEYTFALILNLSRKV